MIVPVFTTKYDHTMDTLAFGYILPITGRIPDFHRLETCASGRTYAKIPCPLVIHFENTVFYAFPVVGVT